MGRVYILGKILFELDKRFSEKRACKFEIFTYLSKFKLPETVTRTTYYLDLEK